VTAYRNVLLALTQFVVVAVVTYNVLTLSLKMKNGLLRIAAQCWMVWDVITLKH